MHPYFFWLFPALPWLIAVQSVRMTAAAFGGGAAVSAEIIPFPERRIRRRAAG